MTNFASEKKQTEQNSSVSNHNTEKSTKQSASYKDQRAANIQLKNLQNNANASNRGKSITQLQTKASQSINNKLPEQLKNGIEHLSGIAMDDVSVHKNSNKPAQLQAHAFAQGNEIHLGPGQEKHLAHEAWHVVQQKQHRVKPTTQLKNKTPVNDDKILEKEADVMGAKALKVGSSPKKTVQKKNNSKTAQRKLIIPDASGALKRYDNKKHGKEQVKNAVAGINDQDNWEKYLFASEDYTWNTEENQWEKTSNPDVEEADQETLESNKMLMEAGKKAAIGGAVGGLVGGVVGGVAGGIAGGAIGLDVPEYAQTLLNEKLWKMGIIAQSVNVNIGYFDIAKFIAGSEVIIEPQLSNITKFMENAGSFVKLDNLHAHIKMVWKSALDVQFEIPQFVANVSINLVDPESGQLTIEANGTITVVGFNAELNSLNSSIPALIYGLMIKKTLTKEDIIEAFKANIHCDNVTGAVSLKTHAFQGNRGKDLGEDAFDANFSMDDLNLENTKADKANTSGNVSNFDAEMNRTGGKKEASAKIHGHGAFSDMAALNDMLKKMEVDVSGFRVYGVAGKVKSKLLESIDKATAENPEAPLSTAVLEIITESGGSLNADKILEGVRAKYPDSDNTKEQVKACCVYLIKKNKIKVSNPKFASLPGAKKTYAKKESKSTKEEVEAIGSKTGKLIGSIGSRLTKDKGIDINMKGQSKDGPGKTKASSEIKIHADKELVEKAYKMLELAHTVFTAI